MRKFVARLKEKKADPERSIWTIIWGKRAKDLEGKAVWMDDDREDHTLSDLRGQIESLKERGKLVQNMIKEIEKEGKHV